MIQIIKSSKIFFQKLQIKKKSLNFQDFKIFILCSTFMSYINLKNNNLIDLI